jgi:hypothetical protein
LLTNAKAQTLVKPEVRKASKAIKSATTGRAIGPYKVKPKAVSDNNASVGVQYPSVTIDGVEYLEVMEYARIAKRWDWIYNLCIDNRAPADWLEPFHADSRLSKETKDKLVYFGD